MSVQTFIVQCEHCGEDSVATVIDITGEDSINLMFMNYTEFTCQDCGKITAIKINTYGI